MSTVSAPFATANVPRFRLTSTIPRAAGAVGVLAGAAATAGAAALRTAGDPLAVRGGIPLAAFVQISLLGAVIGGVLLAVLNRRSSLTRTPACLVLSHCTWLRLQSLFPYSHDMPNDQTRSSTNKELPTCRNI